jgi:hypothetical protein
MTETYDVLTNFCTAFYGKFTELTGGAHNSFFNAVSGQLFEDEAPEGIQYPYAVYRIIVAPKERTFSEVYSNIMLQLSIFSSNPDSSEIKEAYAYAGQLFDEKSLTITGSTLVWMRETNLAVIMEEHTTPTGTQSVKAYHITFEVRTSLT